MGIETSCDETAVALIEGNTKDLKRGVTVIGNIVATSADLHAKTGGIIPENAARMQIKSILPVISEAMNIAFPNISDSAQIKKIDAIAVAFGPGLIGSLLIGVETAKTLSYLWNKPLIPVNHLVAHIYANWITKDKQSDFSKNNLVPKFPALALVVSGGHTDLILMKKHFLNSKNDIEWIGGTCDDAAGEAFDKTARILDLPYPGGPSISAEANKYLERNESKHLNLFPRPIINSSDYNWSFSGLKTAVMNYKREHETANISCTSAEIQEAIVDVLVEKSIKAIKEFRPKSFILSGGVAANSRLRRVFVQRLESIKMKTDFHVPEPKYCTDSGASIAAAAFYNPKFRRWQDTTGIPNLEILGET